MNYNKETDVYLDKKGIPYTSTLKNEFHKICSAYGLEKVSNDEYIFSNYNIKIISESFKIVVLPKNTDSFLDDEESADFYNMVFYFMRSYIRKMEFSIYHDNAVIFSLRGLVQFLDLLMLDKATTKVSFDVLKQEMEDYQKRLIKY